jgi:flagellin FlaB
MSDIYIYEYGNIPVFCNCSIGGIAMQKMNKEEAFTGLEAAIVLIAFVVVAAVFSYVVLGAGFFTTQKAQQTVSSGVDQASSSFEILGDVYGLGSGGSLLGVQFTVGLTAGGSPIDFNSTTISWSTSSTVETLSYDGYSATANVTSMTAGHWVIVERQPTSADTDYLLENQEQFTIIAKPTTAIGVNTDFNLEIKPSVGATLAIKRKTPAQIDAVNLLY